MGETKPTKHERPVALVTGGGTGIGAACCVALAEAGFSVGIHYRSSRASAEALQAKLPDSWLVEADLALPEGVETVAAAVKERGSIDVLVNNAGRIHHRPLPMTSLEDFQDVVSVNLTAVWLLTKRMAGLMIRRRRGRIVNISSVVGSTGNAMQSAYGATKAAVDNLTKTLAMELAPYGIQVNSVAPGLIETAALEGLSPESRKGIVDRIPMGRPGRPEEVARLVRFLAVESSYITGAVLPVNGGLFCG